VGIEQAVWIVGRPRGAALRPGLKRTTLLAKLRRLGISRGLSLRKEPAFPESRKKMPGLEVRTGSRTWNKVEVCKRERLERQSVTDG
jgi:hypothetical protein